MIFAPTTLELRLRKDRPMTTTAPDATYVAANNLQVGDVVAYPCWIGPTVAFEDRTIVGIVEFPANRVLYFAEGPNGVVARTATLRRAESGA